MRYVHMCFVSFAWQAGFGFWLARLGGFWREMDILTACRRVHHFSGYCSCCTQMDRHTLQRCLCHGGALQVTNWWTLFRMIFTLFRLLAIVAPCGTANVVVVAIAWDLLIFETKGDTSKIWWHLESHLNPKQSGKTWLCEWSEKFRGTLHVRENAMNLENVHIRDNLNILKAWCQSLLVFFLQTHLFEIVNIRRNQSIWCFEWLSDLLSLRY